MKYLNIQIVNINLFAFIRFYSTIYLKETFFTYLVFGIMTQVEKRIN